MFFFILLFHIETATTTAVPIVKDETTETPITTSSAVSNDTT